MKSIGNTIINEHFLVIDLKTPSKTISLLEGILSELQNYKSYNSSDFQKYKDWTTEHKNMIYETTQLKIINENIDEQISASWKLKENKFFSPLKKAYSTIMSPIFTYKSKKEMPKILEEINTIETNFSNEHPEYEFFIEDFNKLQNDFMKEIKEKVGKIFLKNLELIDYKGNKYDYLSRFSDVESSICFIENELIPYFEMILDVLHIHIHDIMTKPTIYKYIYTYLNSEVEEIIFENTKEIEKIRNKLAHNETLKLDGYKSDENAEEFVKNKYWETTIKIIKNKKG